MAANGGKTILAGLAALGLAGPAPAAEGPMVLRPAADEHAEGPPRVRLENGAGARVELWRPDLGRTELGEDGGPYALKSPYGNYHAVVARRERGATVETAVRYVYRHGRPSGESPSKLLGAVKADLEIVPSPVPREHHEYRGGHRAAFVVRYRGLPLAGAPVTLRTAHGTVREKESGPEGRVRFRLPADFTGVEPGPGRNEPAEFTLAARHSDGGKTHIARLSAPYHLDPANWRSLGWALVLGGLGFAAGLIGTRRTAPREDAP